MPTRPQSAAQGGDREKPVPRRGGGGVTRGDPSLPCPCVGGDFSRMEEGGVSNPGRATGAGWDQAGGRGSSTSLAAHPGGGRHGALQGRPPRPRGASRLVYMPLVLPRLRLQLYIFLMVQYLPKNCKIKRGPIAGEDSIIIRVNLIRHIIFRNLQLRLMKYLYQSLLDTPGREKTDASNSAFQGVQKCHRGAGGRGGAWGLPI